MNRKNKQNNNLSKNIFVFSLVFFILSLSASLIFYLMIKNMTNEMSVLYEDLVEVSREDVTTLKRSIKKYKEFNYPLDNVLIEKDSAFLFIEEIQDLANLGGLESEVLSVELYDVLENNSLKKVGTLNEGSVNRKNGQLKINMNVFGTWESLVTFLVRLENIPKHIFVDQVKLSSNFNTEINNVVWKASFSIRATTN